MEMMVLGRQELSEREIARRLGCHRATVKKYKANGYERPPYDSSKRNSKLAPHLEKIRGWIEDGLSGVRIFEKLCAQGVHSGSRTVQRAVGKERGKLVKKAFLPFETEPGRQAQVDFGELAVLDESGRLLMKLYLFLMVLGYSRGRYGEILTRTDLTSFLDAHQRAFAFFGGVPQECLYDCMKNVVTRHLGREPEWNDTFYSFALHYGFAPRLCPPYASWVKGKVERPIRFIREGFWRGYRFTGLAETNRDLLDWLRIKEQLIHGTTRQTIVERLGLERPRLGPLPPALFDTSARHFRVVGKDCCLFYGQNRFMVPHRAVGKKIVVRVKDGLLRAYDGAELLATYQVPEGKGNLLTDPRFVEALRRDPVQNRMKYRTFEGRKKGAATIGLMDEPLRLAVQVRDIGVYAALAEGGRHE
jgi:transposase